MPTGNPKLSRRRMATLLAVPAAASIASAQAPAPAPPAADEDQAAVEQRARNNAQAIARVKLPMTTEPAFHFKA